MLDGDDGSGLAAASGGTDDTLRGPGAAPLLVLTSDGRLISRGEIEVRAGAPANLRVVAWEPP